MDFVANILTCRDGLCLRLLPKLHDLSSFVFAIFMICVHDFPCGEVSV